MTPARLLAALLAVFVTASAGGSSFITLSQVPTTGSCGLPHAAFCDTFDDPHNGGTRSGDLDPVIWGVSRATGHVAIGLFDNAWFPTDLDACGQTRSAVIPPADVVICNGQLREATNDGHQVTTLAMYPKQPFDFAGRTGKVVFDVSNDSLNTHDAWPEFWFSDKPVPTPFNHFDSWQALPQDGFGVRFAAGATAGQYGFCPNGNNLDKQRWTVDSAVVVRNFVPEDTTGAHAALAVKPLDCVVAPDGPNGGLNHVELDISQNQIDVYATDAGTTSPLRHIAVITNANLSITRGLIWLEDVHYNASKACCNDAGPHQVHTFAWDNVGFDGPFTYHDLSYDALDALDALVTGNDDGSIDLGKVAPINGSSSWDVLGLPASPQSEAVRVTFNFFDYTNPSTLTVTVNGHAHQVVWPYPDTLSFSWRTYAVSIPITDLVAGTNRVQIGADQTLLVSNVNVVLVNAGSAAAPTSAPVPTQAPSPTVTVPSTPTPGAIAAGCQFRTAPAATAAFCENLAGGASSGGHAGDLDDGKWSVGRFVGGLNQNLMPEAPAQTTTCKTGVTTTNADNDILVCDAASGHLGQFETAFAAEDYAILSMRPRQAFDFTNRTGTITYNVDAVTQTSLGWWTSLYVTEDPVAAGNNTGQVSGMTPRNGVGVNFDGSCAGAFGTAVRMNDVFTFNDYAETDTPVAGAVCIQTRRGSQNHIEIKLSQTSIEVWASDFSPDGGQTFPNFRRIGSAAIALNFSQGYVHFQHAQRAPTKYFGLHGGTYYWSGLGFDGPVVNPDTGYAAPDALTPNAGSLNLGYGLITNPNSTVSCCPTTTVGPLSLGTVTTSGVTSAKLTFSIYYTANNSSSATYAVKYRFNGGAWRSPTPVPEFARALLCQAWGGTAECNWSMGFVVPVALGDLVDGTNTVEIASDGSGNAYPPVLANVELLTFSGAAVPTATPTLVPSSSTPTPAPTATSTPTPTCQVVALVDGQQRTFTRPTSFCTDQ